MSSTISATSSRLRPCTMRAGAAALAALALFGAACGSDSSTSSAAGSPGTQVSDTLATGPTSEQEGTSDGRLAEAAILAPGDLGGSWVTPDPSFEFPNSAELARTVPSCAAFTELVFQGGTDHGDGIGTAMVSPDDQATLFSYVVVFPTVDDATMMIEAVSTPEFDVCWNDFNVAAMKALVGAASDASYATVTPPELTIDADAYTIKSLDGFVVLGGNKTVDTCICVFAQVGRAVVEVHSAAEVFEAAERSRVVQLAIDKMRATLTAAD